jgi:hypothetical protein
VDIWNLGYELAGVVGVHPGPWSLRELLAAVKGRQRELWNHTSSLLAQLAEIHRDPKKRPRPYDAAEIHPMRDRKKPVVKTISSEELKEII